MRKPVRRVFEVDYASNLAHALLWKLVGALDFAVHRYPCRAKGGLVCTGQSSTAAAAS